MELVKCSFGHPSSLLIRKFAHSIEVGRNIVKEFDLTYE